ncbi:MAG: hypothetical protein K2H90_05805, partial [Oscillospiraceae bacterium]|nr:hypothetical protein [Oscillospiraceae bacterium]
SRIRAAADCIASVTDRLFDDISAGDFNAGLAAERFEQIYESVIGLERETAYPEIIYSLTDPKKSDDIIILDKEMIAVAEEIKSSLNSRQGSGGRVRISEDCDRDIFFHMNADSFETAVASMAAECCTAVCCPERIIFSARRSGRDRAEITVMSLDIGSGGSAGSVRGRRPFAYEDEKSFNRRLLSEYIYDVLRLKNGAMFSRESIPGGFVCRMNIEALPRGASVFAQKPVDGSDRLMRISDKVAFFFGDIFDMQAAGKRRYTFRSPVGEQAENDGKPQGA